MDTATYFCLIKDLIQSGTELLLELVLNLLQIK